MHISSSELSFENLLQETFIMTFNTLWRALIKNNNKKAREKKNKKRNGICIFPNGIWFVYENISW